MFVAILKISIAMIFSIIFLLKEVDSLENKLQLVMSKYFSFHGSKYGLSKETLEKGEIFKKGTDTVKQNRKRKNLFN